MQTNPSAPQITYRCPNCQQVGTHKSDCPSEAVTPLTQHTVEIATYDGVTCSLICTCGNELSGVNWEENVASEVLAANK